MPPMPPDTHAPEAAPWIGREELRRRAAVMAFVVLLHMALGLLVLSLAPAYVRKAAADAVNLEIFAVPAEKEPDEPQQEPSAPEPPVLPTPVAEPPPAPPQPPLQAAPPEPLPAPPVIPPPPDSTALAQPPTPPAPPAPPARPARVYGPPDVRPPPQPDSVRVEGSGPNGEPLYAAQWYREPYDDELRGYLSTARGPGWGLIACRTVADYRVQDCVIEGEYPTGSGIARSVQAAAWQFRVRPPRIGGKDQVGEWVRIRIDYEQRRAPAR